MLDARHDLPLCRPVAGQLVGDHDARRPALPLQQLAQEPFGGPFVPPALYQDVEHDAVLVHRHRVAWVGGVHALSPTRVAGYAVRTYSGRPKSNMRFRTLVAMATSVACRPSVCERSPPPITHFQRAISASTRARQLYPDARCQPTRPRSAIHRRCRSRCVGVVPAVSLGTAFARGGTTTAAAGWRAATSA